MQEIVQDKAVPRSARTGQILFQELPQCGDAPWKERVLPHVPECLLALSVAVERFKDRLLLLWTQLPECLERQSDACGGEAP